MTMTIDPPLQTLRARFDASLGEHLPAHLDRLSWDRRRLASHQRDRLRILLAHAAERSPFHARRLRGIDPGAFELEQLPELPVMTKDEMMEAFSDIVTDRTLSRRDVERHLAASTREPSLLRSRYICLASGGSSGLRGIFVQTAEEFAEFVAALFRPLMARTIAAGGPPREGVVVGLVGAASPVHSSGLGGAIAFAGPIRIVAAPATLPLPELVARLNALRPPVLLAHTTRLVVLAGEQRAGRLGIAPRAISSSSELLTPENRAEIEGAFGVPMVNHFTSTEGLVGHSRPGEEPLSFATDICIAEPVDAHNRPVAPGVASDKVLVTNLHNLSQPLIRYELTDRFVPLEPAADHPFPRATVEGRADDVLRYGAVAIDPLVIRSVMVRTPAAREYQVRQTPDGIDVAVVTDGALAPRALADALANALHEAGLAEPQVTVSTVTDIVRHPETGKARRFVPLAHA